jgi:alpha-mannosidase
LLGRRIDTSFKPGEIKTLRIASADDPVGELDLLEWDPAKPPPGVIHWPTPPT